MALLLIVSIWCLIAVLIDLAARDHYGMDLYGNIKAQCILAEPCTTSSSNAHNIEIEVKSCGAGYAEKECDKVCCASPEPIIYPYGTKVDVKINGKMFVRGKIVNIIHGDYDDVQYVVKFKNTSGLFHHSEVRLYKTKTAQRAELKAIIRRIKADFKCDKD